MNLVAPRTGQRAIVDAGVNIVCGTQYIQQEADGSWIDSRFPGMAPILPFEGDPNTQPCSGDEVAFGIPTQLTGATEPSWIMVLCDGERSALADQATMNDHVWNDDWTDIADDRGVSAIEVSSEFISAHILHELLHFVQPNRKLPYISPQDLHKLIHGTVRESLSNGQTEVYSLPEILGLPDDVKSSNTEGYVFLATGMRHTLVMRSKKLTHPLSQACMLSLTNC